MEEQKGEQQKVEPPQKLKCGEYYQTVNGITVEIIEENTVHRRFRGKFTAPDGRDVELIYYPDGRCSGGSRAYNLKV